MSEKSTSWKVKWERDTAIEQLESYGVCFGENKELVEVKHGEWIEGKTLEKCSVCGKKGFPDWHYCPNCGAKMDGGGKE